MKIHETTEKDLKLASEMISTALQEIQLAETEIQTLNMGNDPAKEDERSVSQVHFLTKAEAAEWSRLPQSRQEEFIKEGQRLVHTASVPLQADTEGHRTEGISVSQVGLEQGIDQSGQLFGDGEYPIFAVEKNGLGIQQQNHSDSGKKDTAYSMGMYHNDMKASRVEACISSSITGASSTTGYGTAHSTIALGSAVKSVPKGITGTAATAAVQAGKHAADKFREYLETQAVVKAQTIYQTQQKMKNYQEANAALGTLPASIRYFGAVLAGAVLAVAAVLLQAVTSMVVGMLSVVIAVLVTIVVVFAVISVIISAVAALLQASNPGGYGMPVFVTSDMMQAFFEAQEEYGIPVSSGVAQLIAESGFGLYGPGGESGEGLSKLAYEYKNLFGIKYFSSDQYAAGVVDMTTGEQDAAGGTTSIVAGFSVYPDYAACIRQRAWMLNREPYAGKVAAYLNASDGNYTREQAQGFISGIREAGWATDISYVQKCIRHMDHYNLYRFDNMTWEEFQTGGAGACDTLISEKLVHC